MRASVGSSGAVVSCLGGDGGRTPLERLRDLLRQCPHHGISKHEITQIFYDGLGAPDRYLFDAASGGTFMSKYEDEALELIELVAENSHHHAEKSFGRRSAPAK